MHQHLNRQAVTQLDKTTKKGQNRDFTASRITDKGKNAFHFKILLQII